MPDDHHHTTLDFHIKGNSQCKRGRYRVATRGLSLYLSDVAQAFDIRDLSSSGCNLHDPGGLLSVGRIFDCDLRIGAANYLAGLKFKVIRHANNGVAGVFQALNNRQEIMLDKLLLELQKRDIATGAAHKKGE